MQTNLILSVREHVGRISDSARGNRQFQLYLAGQSIRLWAWALQSLAATWLVYTVTKSTFMLAMVGFSNFIPLLCLGLTGGWVADRFDRRKVLIVTQWLKIIVMAGYAIEAWLGPQVPIVLLLCFFWGTIFVYDQPARQALLLDIVEPEQRVNGVGLNLAVCTIMQMAGTATAGILLSHWGETVCFVLAGLGFAATQLSTLMMQPAKPQPVQASKAASTTVSAALKFVVETKEARWLFVKTAIITFMGTKFLFLLPVISDQLLHGGAGTLAALGAANSVGATLAALAAAGNKGSGLLTKWPTLAILFVAPLLVAFALSGNLWFSLFLMILLGVCMTLQGNGIFSALQILTPDALQGRIVAIFLLATAIIDQVGTLVVAWIEQTYGVTPVLYLCAAVCAGYFFVFRRLDKATINKTKKS